MSGTVASSRSLLTKTRVLAASGLIVAAAAGATIVSILPTRTEQLTTPRLWCSFDVHSEGLMVYKENTGPKQKGTEIGEAKIVSLEEKPLAVACQDDLIWVVTKNSIHKGRVVFEPECCSVSLQQTISHVRAPEYSIGDTEVVAANIWLPVGESRPVVATMTNNGWFQVFRPPTAGPVIDENFILSFKDDPSLNERNNWPANVTGVALGVLGHDAFSIIPFGPDAKRFYYCAWPGGVYKNLVEFQIKIMDIRNAVSDASHISGASPIIYNADRGGWVSIIEVTTTSGETVKVPHVVVPQEVLLQKTTP